MDIEQLATLWQRGRIPSLVTCCSLAAFFGCPLNGGLRFHACLQSATFKTVDNHVLEFLCNFSIK